MSGTCRNHDTCSDFECLKVPYSDSRPAVASVLGRRPRGLTLAIYARMAQILTTDCVTVDTTLEVLVTVVGTTMVLKQDVSIKYIQTLDQDTVRGCGACHCWPRNGQGRDSDDCCYSRCHRGERSNHCSCSYSSKRNNISLCLEHFIEESFKVSKVPPGANRKRQVSVREFHR